MNILIVNQEKRGVVYFEMNFKLPKYDFWNSIKNLKHPSTNLSIISPTSRQACHKYRQVHLKRTCLNYKPHKIILDFHGYNV